MKKFYNLGAWPMLYETVLFEHPKHMFKLMNKKK